MALTTIAKVKEFLGIDNTDTDVELTTLLAYTDSIIKSELGRDIEQAAITDEIHETDGLQTNFFLKEWPVDSDETFTVEFDNDAYDATAYELNADEGILYMDTPPTKSPTKFTVTYTGGYSTVPDDLASVAVMLTADLFKAGGGGNASGIGSGSGEIKSESLKDYSVTYAVSDGGASGIASVSGLLMKYESILSKYKNKHI